MKKIVLKFVLLGSLGAYAQETTLSDALRYGIENLNGTARFRAVEHLEQ